MSRSGTSLRDDMILFELDFVYLNKILSVLWFLVRLVFITMTRILKFPKIFLKTCYDPVVGFLRTRGGYRFVAALPDDID